MLAASDLIIDDTGELQKRREAFTKLRLIEADV